jgi:hypothetical protein
MLFRGSREVDDSGGGRQALEGPLEVENERPPEAEGLAVPSLHCPVHTAGSPAPGSSPGDPLIKSDGPGWG